MRPVPIIPTLIVAAAIATMIALGFWQLHRADWKEGLIARYQQASEMSAEVEFPRAPEAIEAALFRRSSVTCAEVLTTRETASRNLQGTSGLAQVATCRLAGGGTTEIFLGWNQRMSVVDWKGGPISGFVAPSGEGVRLIANPPAFGLLPLAAPDPRELPNNHMAYAWQWFLFAASALVIYALALRKRWREHRAARFDN